MKWNELSRWFRYGILAIPIVAVLSVIVGVLFGKHFLLWLVIPSIIFEELFEKCCYAVSNNVLLNFIFALGFWFGIGALIGKIKG